MLAVFLWSAVATEVSLGRMIEGLPYMWDFVRRMVPPDLSVLGNALRGAVQTIQIAVVGTATAATKNSAYTSVSTARKVLSSSRAL